MNRLKKISRTTIERYTKGDMTAFDEIYDFYSRKLYGFILSYVKQRADAEEIVQEVFLKIWESRKKIDIYASFDSFIFTIAYNTSISLLRKRVNEKKYMDQLEAKQQIYDADKFIDELHFNEINKQVESLLNELTPRQQEIFRLSREDGMSHQEIAQKLSISTNTVKNHLVAALAFLRSNLNNSLMVNALFIYLFLG